MGPWVLKKLGGPSTLLFDEKPKNWGAGSPWPVRRLLPCPTFRVCFKIVSIEIHAIEDGFVLMLKSKNCFQSKLVEKLSGRNPFRALTLLQMYEEFDRFMAPKVCNRYNFSFHSSYKLWTSRITRITLQRNVEKNAKHWKGRNLGLK